ncbi:SDR family oxidoreductase [Octadecabacter sp. SW4]|uniref:SDR family NAD(P)-dependent oxidoreductase n=1 Tax=Octadecabacter sp. SW4 TaxID=2602067 RepID=UPI0011C1E8DB|nr:SDR family oxidoreductase [Octadecabacter sp. SW4]QEE35530.1 SDR family oxidoreductase [Octadecabacter sp. SW4]
MTNTALITGASAGIGKEFARYHASRGGDVIITARRADRLLDLKAELERHHGITAHAFAQDIGTADGAVALAAQVDGAGLTVDILINNAGFGGLGRHVDRALEDELGMIDLNVKTLTALTHYFGAKMAAAGGGKILNVGSTAGMMPGPNQAVYFATKAFVQSFSQAVDQELRAQGVTCTVLCPGYVETEFGDTAGLEGTPLTQNSKTTAAQVAKIGYDAMLRGKLVAITEFQLAATLNWVIPFLPRRMVLKMVEKTQSK